MLRFPLGEMSKPEVREHARRFGLPIADKPDSQDICFVPTGRYSDIVEKLAPQAATPGEIVHVDGRVLGRHAGVMHYTIGQRRGLGLGAAAPAAASRFMWSRSTPAHSAGHGRAALGARHPTRGAARRELDRPRRTGGGGAFGRGDRGAGALDPSAGAGAAGMRRGEAICVEFVDDESGVAPGQACVFYDNAGPRARVLGGGFIKQRRTGGLAACDFALARVGGARMNETRRDRRATRKRPCRGGLCPLGAGLRSCLYARSWRRAAARPSPPRKGGAAPILDVGVGTGLELPMFDPSVNLVGVDLSEPMLRRAQSRLARKTCARWRGFA